jgi:hypothetical protein
VSSLAASSRRSNARLSGSRARRAHTFASSTGASRAAQTAP